MVLGDEKYLLFTTYRRDGRAVASPIWVVPVDPEKLGFWTSSESGKAKRLAHTARVLVQPCDARGRVRAGTEPVSATARMSTATELAQIHKRVVAKYGVMTKITKLLATIAGTVKRKRIPYGDSGVVITLGPA